METMFAAGRRNLPPVPRPAGASEAPADVPTEAAAPTGTAVPSEAAAAPLVPLTDRADDGQDLVARLRAAAPDFAAAAGALSAVVREAVPPARHRRSRCRIVLRFADGTEADLAFLGPAGRPEAGTAAGFGRQIQDWLGSGRPSDPAWLVPDDDAVGGLAVDVTVWLARS
jgi:hypothetical protein